MWKRPRARTSSRHERLVGLLPGIDFPAATEIPTNDVWIAALAIQHGLPLYTRDPHFERIEGLATL